MIPKIADAINSLKGRERRIFVKTSWIGENHRVWIRWGILVMTALAVMYFFIQVPDLVTTFLLAGILSWLFFQPIAWVQSKGVSRVGAVAIVYGSVFFLLLILMSLFLPRLTQEISSAASQSGEYVKQLDGWLNEWENWDLPESIRKAVQENMLDLQDRFFSFFNRFLSGIGDFFGKILSWFIAPILSFYLLKDWPLWKETFLNFFTPATRREICLLGIEVNQVLKNFITGQLLVSIVVGFLTGCAAFIIGVRFAWMLALLGMVGNWIPYLGAVFSGIPALVLAFIQSPIDALWMLLALFCIQQLESNVITPRIMGKKMDLNQLTIIFVVLAGGQLWGIWGMMMAVPLTAALKVILKRVYLMMV